MRLQLGCDSCFDSSPFVVAVYVFALFCDVWCVYADEVMRRHLHLVAGEGKLSRALIKVEYNEIVSILVRSNQPLARLVKLKMPRASTTCVEKADVA